MDLTPNYGALAQDKEFVDRYESFKDALAELQNVLDKLLPMRECYENLPLPEKIDLDLFFAYTMNSLQWIHMKIMGIDPTTKPIKSELNRIKTAMLKWKEIKDMSKRPTVDINAAKRFIKSGLYDRYKGCSEPMNKKIKFNDN